MAILKRTRWFFLAAVVVLMGCLPSNAQNHKITHYRVGQHDLYVPNAYVPFGYTSVGSESGLLQAFYPGAAPIVVETKELHDRGLWYKNVRILFTDLKKYPAFNPENVLRENIRLYKAHEVAGEQYGLTYQTQRDDTTDTWPNELWIERDHGDFVSFISCRKKYAEGVVPQCSHRFNDERFVYEVAYDKRLLPDWRLIRESVLALMASFEAEESARAFLADQISKTLPTQTGESA